MDSFFSIEGPVYRVLAKIWSLMVLNVCILLTSIPLVTIGVSITAAYSACFKLHEKNDTRILLNYFSAFKTNFKQCIIFSVIHFLLLLLFIVDIWYFIQTFKKFSVVMVGVSITIVLTLILTQLVYAYIARYKDSSKKVIGNSFKMVMMNPLTCVFLALMNLVVVVLMLLSSILFIFILYISLFIGISFMIFLKSYLILDLFKKYEKIRENLL